jgi:hypothetical protein
MNDPMNDPTLLKLIALERRLDGLVTQIVELEGLLKRHFELTRALITGAPPSVPPPPAPAPRVN